MPEQTRTAAALGHEDSSKLDSVEAADPTSGNLEPAALEAPVVRAAFGAVNRNRLIDQFLSNSTDEPWKAVYKLILWADKTTGLAHCYESDKCQPGKNWHERALRFHDWLTTACGAAPLTLEDHIDWLFRRVADDYARFMVKQYTKRMARAAKQRAPYQGRDFPEPGDDPGIVAIIREVLGAHLVAEPTHEQWRLLTSRIRDFVSLENKRKNIVGEGFEDVLAAVIRRATPEGALKVHARRLLHDVPGFANRRQGDKPTKVDLAVVRGADNRRILVTVKWSTRADREEQFRADFAKYVQAESENRTFDYVLITNEFDPARLKRACELNAGNSHMLTNVVHICPDALRAVYGEQPEATMGEVVEHLDSGRILGLDAWIASLLA
jgi:hypothetical protein